MTWVYAFSILNRLSFLSEIPFSDVLYCDGLFLNFDGSGFCIVFKTELF